MARSPITRQQLRRMVITGLFSTDDYTSMTLRDLRHVAYQCGFDQEEIARSTRDEIIRLIIEANHSAFTAEELTDFIWKVMQEHEPSTYAEAKDSVEDPQDPAQEKAGGYFRSPTTSPEADRPQDTGGAAAQSPDLVGRKVRRVLARPARSSQLG